MKSASGETYVSRKVMNAYQKQRARNQKKAQASVQQPAEESKGPEPKQGLSADQLQSKDAV